MIPVAVQVAAVFSRVIVLACPVDGLTRRFQVARVQAGEGEAEARLVLVLSVARYIGDFAGVLKVFTRLHQPICIQVHVAQTVQRIALAVTIPDVAGDGQMLFVMVDGAAVIPQAVVADLQVAERTALALAVPGVAGDGQPCPPRVCCCP